MMSLAPSSESAPKRFLGRIGEPGSSLDTSDSSSRRGGLRSDALECSVLARVGIASRPRRPQAFSAGVAALVGSHPVFSAAARPPNCPGSGQDRGARFLAGHLGFVLPQGGALQRRSIVLRASWGGHCRQAQTALDFLGRRGQPWSVAIRSSRRLHAPPIVRVRRRGVLAIHHPALLPPVAGLHTSPYPNLI